MFFSMSDLSPSLKRESVKKTGHSRTLYKWSKLSVVIWEHSPNFVLKISSYFVAKTAYCYKPRSSTFYYHRELLLKNKNGNMRVDKSLRGKYTYVYGEEKLCSNVGLEPTTLRITVSCSTDRASQAYKKSI